MHSICKPFQIKFLCATFQKNFQNASHFVTLFSAHGDVVVGFAIFHIVLFQKEEKKEKRHSSMVCEYLWNRLAIVCERKKKVGRSAKLYKRASKCQYLFQKLALFLYGR
jgi:hypothetical protein